MVLVTRKYIITTIGAEHSKMRFKTRFSDQYTNYKKGSKKAMNEQITSKKQGFMVQQWNEIRKAGGLAISIDEMTRLFAESEDKMISRNELIFRVTEYFKSCLQETIDEDGNPATIWRRNPTKTGLALSIGVEPQTLIDYVKGINSSGKPYSDRNAPNKIISKDDFDIVRKAYSLIESFYEEKLGENRNNAGVIYWLNNRENSKWSNQQEFTFSTTTQQDEEYARAEAVPILMQRYQKQASEELPDFESEDE